MSLATMEQARDLISNRYRWTRNPVEALDGTGTECDAKDREAVRWSLYGAICRYAADDAEVERIWYTIRMTAEWCDFGGDAWTINDHGTHKQVLELLDASINTVIQNGFVVQPTETGNPLTVIGFLSVFHRHPNLQLVDETGRVFHRASLIDGKIVLS